MEIIARISRGSRMDQVYIPKNRSGFQPGSYVVLSPAARVKRRESLYMHGMQHIEPIKVEIVHKVVEIVRRYDESENIIITGSFVDPGFDFRDIDIIIISSNAIPVNVIGEKIAQEIGIRAHIIAMDNAAMVNSLAVDPVYQIMLSKCIAEKRFIYRVQRMIDYRLLDLHLLKSKTLIDNFEMLSGREKYYLTRNIISIALYLRHEKIHKEMVEKEITKVFGIKNSGEIRENMVQKAAFVKRFRNLYKSTFAQIMGQVTHEQE